MDVNTVRLEQVQSQQMRQEQRQVLRMEQAELLEMPEDEFQKLVSEVEKSPLFRNLYRKVIHYQRLPRTDISSSFCEPKDELIADRGSSNVDSLLLNKEKVIELAKKLGIEKFKRYFLFPEEGLSLEDVAADCDVPVEAVQKINELINDFSIMKEFNRPSDSGPDGVYYTKVASVETDRDGFVIGYLSASMARGKYNIDYYGFEQLRAEGKLAEPEVKEAKQLFKKLELINNRKDTLTRILQRIIEKQSLYLDSGDVRTLLPFSQKELASQIDLAASSVCRAISAKSIETPWRQEIPLKQFFPSPRKFKKDLLKKLIESDRTLSSDEAIRKKLWERFGVAISRRSVANMRQDLKLPSARGRRQLLVKTV